MLLDALAMDRLNSHQYGSWQTLCQIANVANLISFIIFILFSEKLHLNSISILPFMYKEVVIITPIFMNIIFRNVKYPLKHRNLKGSNYCSHS